MKIYILVTLKIAYVHLVPQCVVEISLSNGKRQGKDIVFKFIDLQETNNYEDMSSLHIPRWHWTGATRYRLSDRKDRKPVKTAVSEVAVFQGSPRVLKIAQDGRIKRSG